MIAVANPLRGLRTDAQYVRGLLDTVEGPVVLAGHSYGGSVMSEAAEVEASHAVTVSQPGAVADLITTAADPSTH